MRDPVQLGHPGALGRPALRLAATVSALEIATAMCLTEQQCDLTAITMSRAILDMRFLHAMAMQMKKELAMLELVCQVSHILSIIKFFVGNMFFLVSLIETNYLRANLYFVSQIQYI